MHGNTCHILYSYLQLTVLLATAASFQRPLRQKQSLIAFTAVISVWIFSLHTCLYMYTLNGYSVDEGFVDIPQFRGHFSQIENQCA
jgi:hypothetical protein